MPTLVNMNPRAQFDHQLRFWKDYTFDNDYIGLKCYIDGSAEMSAVVEPRRDPDFPPRWMVPAANS